MRRTFQFHPQARSEFLDAIAYYEEHGQGLGTAFNEEVRTSIDQVITNPWIGARYKAGTRRVLLRRFPFYLIYSVQAEVVTIIAVAHQRRRPGFWDRRTR